jgi:hypothetical protein
MNDVVISWKESLHFLKPATLKLFCLVTLKSLLQTYVLFFTYFSWLLGLQLLLYYYFRAVPEYNPCMFLVASIVFLVFLLSARSSIEKKEWSYFVKQFRDHGLSYLVGFLGYWILFICMVVMFIGLSFYMVVRWGSAGWIVVRGPWLSLGTMLLGLLKSFFIVSMQFLFDSKQGLFKALQRGSRMVFYNAPFFVLTSLLFGLCIIMRMVFFPHVWLTGLWLVVVQFVIDPLHSCFFTNFYIKRVHDQFDCYMSRDNL